MKNDQKTILFDIPPSSRTNLFIIILIALIGFSCASRKPEKPKRTPEEIEQGAESMFQEMEEIEKIPEKKDKKPENIKPETRTEETPEFQPTSEYQEQESIYPRKLGGGWIETMGEAQMVNITYEKAQQIANERANTAAILLAVGERISSSMFIYQDSGGKMDIADFSQSVSAGHIVEAKDEIWTNENLSQGEGKPPIVVVRVIKKVKVKKDKGASDPSFHIQANLNEPVFSHGEKMEISITPTQDCYITIFNQSKCDNDAPVYILFPNDNEPDNFIQSGNTTVIPGKSHHSFTAQLLEGQDECMEFVKIIATKNKIPFTGNSEDFFLFQTMQKRTAAQELARWLTKIPLSERAEENLFFKTVR